MKNYQNESVYTCSKPRLLVTDCATSPDQYKTWKITKKGDICSVLRYTRYARTPIVIRCGSCVGCRKLANDQWFLRLYHHYLSHPDSKLVFITLSFNEDEYRYIREHLTDMPKDEYHGTDFTEVYRHYVVPFKKRLRAKRGENMQFDFFCVSEFGEKTGRFHFHICLFLHNWSFFSQIAVEWNRTHPYSKHYIKTSKGQPRLQTDLESFLQHKIERQWCADRKTSLSDRYVFTRYKNGQRSISAKDPFGNVTLFIPDSVGAIKYITSYTMKCQHDGSSTYHRQTGGLGKKYAADYLSEQIYDNSVHVGFAGKVKGKSMYIPLPRVYFRWFGDKAKMIEQFWTNLPLQLQRFISSQHKDSLYQFFDDDLEQSTNFG